MVSVTGEAADAELIAAVGQNEDAFALLYDRHAAQLYRYAYPRVGREAAEDVVADTFLAAFRSIDRYDTTRPDARAWLFGIATNVLARHRRTERARYRALAKSSGSEQVELEFAELVDSHVSAVAASRTLAKSLARLAARDRDVLLLVAWAELTYEQVSQTLNIPVGTVRSRLNRARRKMREMLKSNDVEVSL
ncbi:RNA polymerase sigma factor [Rugosimonospora africana]|uniref:DNA-directed RNA polymerase sigma-70 factor n=1 Tax=Rugosimonospora africana TaxID=556532 RepID=A0A8J3VSM7_9ACTN|nr:RNA polymerase sigma factor [Rugosimonospora africana]GIH16633.1 DNA-directed RNA polymerase sigma-70 factor [Rugosimonospora africana]